MKAEILFLVWIFMLVVHFFYEFLILPTLRDWLQLKILDLENQLRWLWLEASGKSDPAFEVVETSLNVAYDNVARFDLAMLYRVATITKTDKRSIEVISECSRIVEVSPCVELRVILNRLDRYSLYCVIVNTGDQMILVAPIVFCVYFVRRLLRVSSDFGRSIVRGYLFLALTNEARA